MYIPKHFEESRTEVLHELIRAHPLATFIVTRDGEIAVNHFPLVISADGGGLGVLEGHVPRANPVWQSLDGDTKAIAVFDGPQAYITPSWYPSKHEHGKAVPTWNYVVAHAHGKPTAVEDRDWLLAHLNALTDQQEATRHLPWKVSDAPRGYVDAMLGKIVGIRMRIEALEGKRKVGQNRPQADRLGVAAGLRSRGGETDLAMEALVRAHIDE